MASTSASQPQPAAQTVLFARGVIAQLALWPALRLAVDNGWGGPESSQKRIWLASNVVDAFTDALPSESPDREYVEEMLLQVMSDEFEVTVEDESSEKVAKDIVQLWVTLGRNADAGRKEVERLEGVVDRMKGKKIETKEEVNSDESMSGSEEDGEDDSSEEEAPPLREPGQKQEPEVDEDGFTTVMRKIKR